MSDPVPSLVLDLLEWLGAGSRPYAEVLEVWRTSCPRLPVWETANAQGFIEHSHAPGRAASVALSVKGRSHLLAHRPPSQPPADKRAPDPAPAPDFEHRAKSHPVPRITDAHKFHGTRARSV